MGFQSSDIKPQWTHGERVLSSAMTKENIGTPAYIMVASATSVPDRVALSTSWKRLLRPLIELERKTFSRIYIHDSFFVAAHIASLCSFLFEILSPLKVGRRTQSVMVLQYSFYASKRWNQVSQHHPSKVKLFWTYPCAQVGKKSRYWHYCSLRRSSNR